MNKPFWTILHGADLSKTDLRGAELSSANLYSAYLRGADLSNANLLGANLSRACLCGADLSNANMNGADLSRANLSRANLYRADLRGADLSNANMSGADLNNANLRGAGLNGRILIGDRPILQIAPIGPSGDCFMAFLTDVGIWLLADGFAGDIEEFEQVLLKTYRGNNHTKEYQSALAMIRSHADIWTPPKEENENEN